jgi:hypothetical protein
VGQPVSERSSSRHREAQPPAEHRAHPPVDELPQVGAEPKPQEASPPPEAAAKAERKKERTPRRDGPGCCARRSRWRFRLCLVWRQAPSVGVPDGTRRGARHFGAPGVAHAACSAGSSAGATPAGVVVSLQQ